MTTPSPARRSRMPLLMLMVILGFPQAGSAEEPEFLSLRAMIVSEAPPRPLHFVGENGFTSLRVSSIQPSGPIRVRFANPLPIFEQIEPPPEGEGPVQAGQVNLPPDTRNVLLLYLPGSERTPFTAIEDDLPTATARDWRVINATRSAIAFQVGQGTNPILLPPQSRQSFRISPSVDGGAAVTAAARIEGAPVTFFSTYWPVDPTRRALILFVGEGEDIQVRRITERIPERE